MKKLALITICALLFSFTVNAQKVTASKVPAVLKTAFAKDYPKATDVKWEKEGGSWEVAFKNNGEEMTVALDSKGAVVEVEVPIKVTELPAAVTKYVADKFKGKPILSADKITAGGKVTYEVVVQKGKAILFDAAGKYMSTGKD